MTTIAFYVTGHGYGHMVRSLQIVKNLKRLCPQARFHIKSSAPGWFTQGLGFPVSHSVRPVDVGIIQSDSLEMHLQKTVRACKEFHAAAPKLIEEELAFVRREKVRLILGDIPALCFEIAQRASLPGVAVTNFTWNWIYRSYLSEAPALLPLIEQMELGYRQATLCLSLPYACDLEIFPRVRQIPLITRISELDRLRARKRFGVPEHATVVLLSFGGFGLRRLPWRKITDSREFFFVTTDAHAESEENLLVLPKALVHYEDLVRAADVVVSKPGYGIVADVIAHRVPLLYTDRGFFPEQPYLIKMLEDWATSEFIPQAELLAGNLGPYLKRLLLKTPHWPEVRLDGAEVAAETILNMIRT